jgi:predicted nuclease with RNAse H fold
MRSKIMIDKKITVVGIDLAGSEKNPSGWASLKNGELNVCEFFKDNEICNETASMKPDLVAIDAPLSKPVKGILRFPDREMLRRHYPVFPPLFKSMQSLTERAIRISESLGEININLIEVHPSSSMKALGVPKNNLRRIKLILKKYGLLRRKIDLTTHEIDAAFSAITAYLHVKGLTELVGNIKEGFIVLPLGDKK